MTYGLRQNAAPATEPVTVAEIKAHCRVTVSTDDTYLTSLGKAVRQHFESVCNRALISQSWDVTYDSFPQQAIYLPYSPVTSVTHIKYYDEAGTQQTLSASAYQVQLGMDPAPVVPAYGYSWPATRAGYRGAVEVRFVAGYANAAAVPDDIKQALLVLIGHFYENREDTISGTIISKLPYGFDALIAPHRIWMPA